MAVVTLKDVRKVYAGNVEAVKELTVAAVPQDKPTTTTVAVVDTTVSTKEDLVINVTVTAAAKFSGKIQLFDGSKLVVENPVFSAPVSEGHSVVAFVREPASGLATGKRSYTVKFVSDTQNVTGSSAAPVQVEIYFFDSAPGTPFHNEIAWLAEQGITTGQDGGFQPGLSVSRQAMAAFLFRLKNPNAADAPECTVKPFTDVAISNQFCGEIAWLKTQNITAGYAGGTFKPTGTIDRQAMARSCSAWTTRAPRSRRARSSRSTT